MNPPSEKDLNFVRRILLELFTQAQKALAANEEDGSPPWWSDPRTVTVCQHLYPFSDIRTLEAMLPSIDRPKGNLQESGAVLFLQQVEREKALPVLDISWNWTPNERPETRFKFFLFHWEDEKKEKPNAIGFRFDAPEGPGAHNYWHAQMISGFEKQDDRLIAVLGTIPDWIPEKQPAIPVPARNVGDLLATLLVSIYGLKQLRDLLRGTTVMGELSGRLSRMHIRV